MNNILKTMIEEEEPLGEKIRRYKRQLEGGGPQDQAGGVYMGPGEEGTLRRMAAQTQQPYRPGWGALPGVATSIVGGMAAAKLRGNEREKAHAERQAWGIIGAQNPDWGRVMQTAPVGGRAHSYAIQQMTQRAEQDKLENDPEHQLNIKLKQAQLNKAQRPPERRIVKGPDGRSYYADDQSQVLPGIGAEAAGPKQEATQNIGGMINRLGQVTQFDGPEGPGKSPYTPHEVESSIGNWQGDDESWILGPVSRVGGWLTTLGSEHAPRDIRARITGDTLALSSALKKVARGAGEGVFTDADQRLLERQIGELSKASSVEDYKQRLSDIKSRINAAYGLSIGGQPGQQQGPQLGQQTVPQPGPQSGPQPGSIEDGHIFRGGDPANPASWEPVQ